MKNKLKWIVVTTTIILLVVLVFLFLNRTKKVEFSSTTVEKINLVQSVEETGTVTASLEINSGFEMSGKVVEILKEVGDNVKKGDQIAKINNTAQLSNLQQARAALNKALADLNLKITGVSQEEIDQSLANIAKAEASLEQTKAQKEQTIISSQTKIETAESAKETAQNDLQEIQDIGTSRLVSDAYADLYNTLLSTLPTINDALRESDNILGIDNTVANDDFEELLGNIGSDELNVARSSYINARQEKNNLQLFVNNITGAEDETNILMATIQAKSAISTVRNHLNDTKNLLNFTSSGSGLTQSELDTLKSNITTEIANLNTKNTSLTNDRQAVDTAKNTLSAKQIAYNKALADLESAKRQAEIDEQVAEASVLIKQAALNEANAAHQKLIAKPREVDLASLRADVDKQRAALFNAQENFDKTILKAIESGVISKIDVEVGENAVANQTILTIISPERNIEVDISESNIAKISIDDSAEITLDAFGDDVIFAGHVVSIEPAETEISGVIYYKTKIVFDDSSEDKIKPGMTANVRIITEKKDNVLVVPQRAIINEAGKKFIRILTNPNIGSFEKQEITAGLKGDDGLMEILSGLEEGQEIITFIKEEEE